MLVPIFILILEITIGIQPLVMLEREISACIRQYIGSEYTCTLGILQAIANGIKFLLKENLIPSRGGTRSFSIGPSIVAVPILLTY